MDCPYCGYEESKVIDSRNVSQSIRRRRERLKCAARFTTYERAQHTSLFVIKKDLRREEFSREKLLSGVHRACEKRPLPTGTIEKAVDDIETELFQSGKAEVKTSVIGELVMEKLKKLDYIAYIRFASVYRPFTDITALKQAVDNLVSGESKVMPTNQLTLLPEEQPLNKPGRRSRK